MALPPVRVRFAPSPTGSPHIGGARTALYNYLLARQTGGQFILRIEDTDRKRNTPQATQELMTGLRWLGLHWDEGPDVGGPHGPYIQSERKDLHWQAARQLLDSGHAYRCFCSPARLEGVRAEQARRKEPQRYDGTCRGLDPAEAERRAAAGELFTVRFKTPQDGTTTAHDYLRGDITVDNRTIDDFILVRSDGYALYHLGAMVDDHAMGITHVMRSSEWLGTFPLHVLVIRALGWPEPVFVHLSVFLNPTGKGKLSKRNVTSEKAVSSVEGLRDLGYLPEAVNAWMALMGVSFGAEERLMDLEEMVAEFNLDRLNPAPARVNFEKLDHFNGLVIRRMAPEELARRIQPYFEQAGIPVSAQQLLAVVPVIRERIVTLPDAVEMAGFFFRPSPEVAPADLAPRGLQPGQALDLLREAHRRLESVPAGSFTHDAIEAPLRALAEERGVKPGVLFGILRVAVTGQTVSPPLFESMVILGRERTLERTAKALAALAAA